jgi:hypothetical protein
MKMAGERLPAFMVFGCGIRSFRQRAVEQA